MITTIGIDLAKTTLHAVVMDAGGKVVQRRRLDRTKLLEWLANQGPCLVGMEACAGAHHLARALAAQGHDVRLMPGQYVKPFVKTHKNDLTDAEAICEAVQRPPMRFCADQDAGAARRAGAAPGARTRLVGVRTALINQIRGFLLERARDRRGTRPAQPGEGAAGPARSPRGRARRHAARADREPAGAVARRRSADRGLG